jgi:hypothetical protein
MDAWLNKNLLDVDFLVYCILSFHLPLSVMAILSCITSPRRHFRIRFAAICFITLRFLFP